MLSLNLPRAARRACPELRLPFPPASATLIHRFTTSSCHQLDFMLPVPEDKVSLDGTTEKAEPLETTTEEQQGARRRSSLLDFGRSDIAEISTSDASAVYRRATQQASSSLITKPLTSLINEGKFRSCERDHCQKEGR